jgi:hypothetical protein
MREEDYLVWRVWLSSLVWYKDGGGVGGSRWAGVAASEEGWFLLLKEETCGEEGEVYGGCSYCQ